jgi:hypothetical protein
MEKRKQNTFFTEEIYRTQIGLDMNEDVLKKMYADNVNGDDKLPIEFFFVCDNIDNVLDLQSFIKLRFSEYENLKVRTYNNLFELSGITQAIKMKLESINKWNQIMWDLGYEFDCKLDGWQVQH